MSGTALQEGAMVWIEIPATGPKKELRSFYRDLFPAWKFHDDVPGNEHPEGYSLPGGTGGGIVPMPKGCQAQDQPNGIGMTVYYKVNDLEKTEAKVHELGGKTCLGKTKQGEGGWFMNFLDPQGNRFGVYEFAK